MNTPAEMPDDSSSNDPLPNEHESPLTISPATVTPMTVLRFLRGDRQAILDLARCRHTIWLGGVLVLSAGFAREYDGEDLSREPWHLFIPHAASLVTSFVLYFMVRLVALQRAAALQKFFRGFRIFLGLYWMTAPLAWVYAIPFERWLSPGDATQLNLTLLGLVSLCRVVLIIRVIQVAFGARTTMDVIMTVLLFSDAVMLTAISFIPIPLLQLMGGIRLTETEAVLQSTVLLLRLAGVPGLAIFVIGYALACQKKPPWEPPVIEPSGKISSPMWIVAALAVLGWGAVLPFTQPEQQLRWQVEHDLECGRISEALRVMSAHEPSDFPPHWDPPPHVALQRHSPDIVHVVFVVVSENPADWVRELYLEKFQRKFAEVFSFYSGTTMQQRAPYLKNLSDLPLELWYPDDEWQADQFRTLLKEMASSDERAAEPEIRELAREVLLRLPDKPAPDIRQPQDDHEEVPEAEADPATAAGDQLLRELQPRIVESP